MSTLTIILLVYVILDIIATTFVVIRLKSMGYTFKGMAWRLFHKPRYTLEPYEENEDDEFTKYEDISEE